MKSLSKLLSQPVGFPITADDILEYHATRLLLLIYICGTTDRTRRTTRIDGLTKFAKLDFFVRYPSFFEKVAESLNITITPALTTTESKMVRHHYGPWDKRYYQLLPYLEARELITVEKNGTQFQFVLTQLGKHIAEQLSMHNEFESLTNHMRSVKDVLGKMSGNALKTLIYQVFDAEVAQKPLGEIIQP